ncbi:MAG TPA: SAM-dependent methyltransferase [Streptosporangiaceae bacterium]
MVTDSDWRTTFRPDIPSSARIYDYFLGGKDNFPADREAAEEIAGYLPVIREAAQWNRAFVGRAVRFLVKEAGITQLLDIGSGLPTKGNVHEVAHAVDPEIRVVYVDHDPVVLVHARDLLAKERNAVIIKYDMREPEQILADHELRHQLDLTQPVGLLFVSMLHFLPDDADPASIISRLLAPFPAGSHVALTHGTADADPYVKDAAKVYEEATTKMFVRTKTKVLEMVSGLDLVEPGLVWTPQWRPDPGDNAPANPADSYYYALAARKP